MVFHGFDNGLSNFFLPSVLSRRQEVENFKSSVSKSSENALVNALVSSNVFNRMDIVRFSF